VRPHGKHGSHPPTPSVEMEVPDGEHTFVNRNEESSSESPVDEFLRETQVEQLSSRHHSMLPLRQLPNQPRSANIDTSLRTRIKVPGYFQGTAMRVGG
jgi:hypothetical protein